MKDILKIIRDFVSSINVEKFSVLMQNKIVKKQEKKRQHYYSFTYFMDFIDRYF